MPPPVTAPSPEDLKHEVERVRALVEHRFQVTDVRYDQEAFAYFVQVNMLTLEEEFDELRREMMDAGYIPMLLREREGLIVYVSRLPKRKFRSIWVNIVLLVATIFTTIFAGMTFVSSYESIGLVTWESAWKGAVYFAAPLMLVLSVHEMGHFLMARHHHVAASLPFFLPAPPILGTFGAAISLREPIPSKRALIDIGFAGPITGFVVAIFVTILGLQLSAWDPHPTGDDASVYVILGTPLIYQVMSALVPTPEDVLIHPTAFAGWVGFLVTFLNLLPVGQLDGGHIARALLGDRARLMGYVTIAAVVLVSLLTGYWGWIIYLVLIVFFVSVAHPPPLNDVSPLPVSRVMVGTVAFILLAVCFVPVPMAPSPLHPDMEVHVEPGDVNVAPDGWANVTMVLNNTGNTRFTARIELQEDHGWNVTFGAKLRSTGPDRGRIEVLKSKSESFLTRLNVSVAAPNGSDLGLRETFTVEIRYANDKDQDVLVYAKFTATVGWIEPREVPANTLLAIDRVVEVPLRLKSHVHGARGEETRFLLGLSVPGGAEGLLTNGSVANVTVDDVRSMGSLGEVALTDNGTVNLRLWLYAAPGTPLASGLQADLSFEPEGTNMTIVLPVAFDIVNPIYDVALFPQYENVTFRSGEQRAVAFQLLSRSTVDVTVRFTYTVDGPDFTIVEKEDELVLPPGYDQVKSVTIDPVGDVGAHSELVIEMVYGPDWSRRESTTIDLLVTQAAGG